MYSSVDSDTFADLPSHLLNRDFVGGGWSGLSVFPVDSAMTAAVASGVDDILPLGNNTGNIQEISAGGPVRL